MEQLRLDADAAKDEVIMLDAEDKDAVRKAQWNVKFYYWMQETAEMIIETGLGPEKVAELDAEEEAYESG